MYMQSIMWVEVGEKEGKTGRKEDEWFT